ncbi:MAG: GH25 family lysozyme [Eubacteriales bacterium]|nr:GH25 family lysozyme [Eubacteriales bacterium]
MTLPIYPDMEDNSQRSAGASAILNTAEIFCSAMKANGYQAGIYASTNWWNNELEPLAFDSNYHHWIAQWSSREPMSADCELWQYSSKGDKA